MYIKIEDLSYSIKKFPRQEKILLEGISLQLNNGIHGLLGVNGAGKTTLLRCIAGIYEVKQGTITFGEGANIGYMPQNYGMMGNLTVYENLEYLSILKKYTPTDLPEQILECLGRVNLLEEKDKKCKKLSGGMLRRLGLAQAIINKPNIILLDEPAASLDPQERMNLREIIREIGEESVVLLSTHLVEDIGDLCEDIVVMNAGKVKIISKDIIENKNLEDAFSCLLKEF